MSKKKTAIAAPEAGPAPIETVQSLGNKYQLFVFKGNLFNPNNEPGIVSIDLPICGHFVYNTETGKINGQAVTPLVSGSTLIGKMDMDSLNFSIEDVDLETLISFRLFKRWLGEGKICQCHGSYDYKKMNRVASVEIDLINNYADRLVKQFPHVFGLDR